MRCRQVESIFDVPPQEKFELKWEGELPINDIDWNVGLIVGPSGSGKSTIAKQVFSKNYGKKFKWPSKSVIDDFPKSLNVNEIARALSSVGFNTIPAWFRPFSALSTGEKFRVELARSFLQLSDPIVIDEFTSVVDRQVAKIGAYAVQKYIKRNNRKFVGISCHYDIIDWLDPDWLFEPATMTFKPRGALQQIKRPEIECEIKRVTFETWKLFAPYHYLTMNLHRAARCYGLFINDRIVSFIGILYRPHNTGKKYAGNANIYGISRAVTSPDWQGLGLIFVLMESVASIYNALNKRIRMYPAHPPFIRAMDKSSKWRLDKKPKIEQRVRSWQVGKSWDNMKSDFRSISRPCAVFEYIGGAFDDKQLAEKVYNSEPFSIF
jgi:ABC-type molybdenum transport system ATPase subunit/photorepair protein PhrA